MRRLGCCVALLLLPMSVPLHPQPPAPAEPLRLGMAGLVHGHASGFLTRYLKRQDVRLVGIAEPDQAVASRYRERFGLEPSMLFSGLEAMLDKARPEAVVVFTDTFDHLRVVEACAARGIPVMMEKPLAVSVEHARAIERASRNANIPVMVNYETTWYASNRAAWSLVKEQKAIGDIRKIVVHDGHSGPRAINVQPEFFAWLTDPVRNGAGALFDFGCYGANLMTWLMDGQRPLAVTAVTQRFQPDTYREVEDEATILVEYPSAQGIIQASWNWPFDRKDMEIYGQRGQVFALRGDGLRIRMAGQQEAQSTAAPIPAPEDDFVRYLAAVVRKEIKPAGLSSLENNLIVTDILDAARRSAATGKRVVFQ
jgi:predicted dehydrogenase